MAIFRPSRKFLHNLMKFSTNYQVRIHKTLLLNTQFRGYVHLVNSTTYRYYNIEKKELSSVNNDNKIQSNDNTIDDNKSAELRRLMDCLDKLNSEFHDMKVDYGVLMSALRIFSESPEDIDDNTAILLLNCCGEVLPDVKYEVRRELTERVWEVLEKAKPEMSLVYYHTYLNVCAQNGAIIEPEKFINSLKIAPDYDTFRCLLNVAARNGDSDGANYILMRMKELNYSVNHEILSALIELYSRKGDMESVNSVFETISSSGMEPSGALHGALAWGYAIQNDIENVLDTLKTYPIDDKYLLLIIKTLSLSGNGKNIEQILKFSSRETMIADPLLHNIVIELVHSGKSDDALLIINFYHNTFIKTKTVHLAKHFLTAIVRAATPKEIVLKIGRDFHSLYPPYMILHSLLGQSLRSSHRDLSLLLLEEMNSEKIEIRPHYYWPLLKQACENQGEPGIFQIMQHMNQLHVLFDYDTLFNYVIPYINMSKPHNTLSQLQKHGVSMSLGFESLVSYLLHNGQLSQTLSLCKIMKSSRENLDTLPVSLIEAYKKTQDVEGCTKVLKHFRKMEKYGAQFLLQLANDKFFRGNMLDTLNMFINAYSEHGLWISSSDAGLIQEMLAYNCKNIDEILESLSFAPIVHKSDQQESNSGSISVIPHPKQMTESQLENHLIELESKKMNTRGLLRKLFMVACKNNNLERVEQLKREFDMKDVPLTFGMKANLLDFYTRHNRIPEVLNLLSDLRENHADSIIDTSKIINAATALANHNKVEMALEIIGWNGTAKYGFQRGCWKLLDAIARSSHAHLIDSALELLVQNGYAVVDTTMMGPSIRRHLLKNDIKSAVGVFKKVASQYKVVPLHQELVCNLVELHVNNQSDNEEVELMLRDVMRLISGIKGRKMAKMDLLISYARCGMREKLRAALTDLERDESLEKITTAMPNDIKSHVLTAILDASNGMKNIDRQSIYELALSTYNDMGKCEDAINLWRKMNDEGIVAPMVFKQKLTDLLERHKVQIPHDL